MIDQPMEFGLYLDRVDDLWLNGYRGWTQLAGSHHDGKYTDWDWDLITYSWKAVSHHGPFTRLDI